VDVFLKQSIEKNLKQSIEKKLKESNTESEMSRDKRAIMSNRNSVKETQVQSDLPSPKDPEKARDTKEEHLPLVCKETKHSMKLPNLKGRSLTPLDRKINYNIVSM